eukprot:CAMPEP_0202893236 /NCGR_PEP_ID=MMETSP1392-20130828/2844_1 /ASSEMBLY_ACC=CAM_ASM_000868 /TAXON_ID=225041 /ORGANISM="Chlamydomonas chlamydogama, Strain SAG 11-48b" /LENGTH=525 /DNA_ID=CAMNT_0049577489 /DNA_START=225 /DNA_END=1802 /DNA_ORIENTATION=-
MVAERVLDTNKLDTTKPELSDYEANLSQNISDCLEVLAQLSVGLDVNPRFYEVHAFEATKELTVFDLLDISLVHGWVFDPQDEEAGKVIGQRSYNELVELLISTLDAGAVDRIESNTSLHFKRPSVQSAGSSSYAPKSIVPSHVAPASAGHVAGTTTDTRTLHSPAHLTLHPRPSDSATPASPSKAEAAFTQAVTAVMQDLNLGEGPSASSAPSTSAGPSALPPAAALVAPIVPTLSADSEQQARRAYEAVVVKDFLEANCSQLTVYGLARMQERLRENQLAVFFRNNHFNVIFRYNSQLYLLVTDQGYLREPSVVWERLDTVDGDTQMCTASFTPYVAPERSAAVATGVPLEALQGLSEEDAAAIALAATEGLDHGEPPRAAGLMAAAQGPPMGSAGHDVDADLALALQLQQQEEMEMEARQAEEQARRQQQQQAQQQAQRQSSQQQQQWQRQAGQDAYAQQQQIYAQAQAAAAQAQARAQSASGQYQQRPAAGSRPPAGYVPRPAPAQAPQPKPAEESKCHIM